MKMRGREKLTACTHCWEVVGRWETKTMTNRELKMVVGETEMFSGGRGGKPQAGGTVGEGVETYFVRSG